MIKILPPEVYQNKHIKEYRDMIILNYTALVKSRLKQFHIIPDDYDDVLIEGMIGLIKAVDNFDPNYGTQFSTFATPYIDGTILTYFKKHTISYSLDDNAFDDDDDSTTKLDMLQDEHIIEDDIIQEDLNNYRMKTVTKWIDNSPLPQDHKDVYKYILEGYTIHDTAIQFNIKVVKVQSIINKMERMLKHNLILSI